MSEMKRPFLAAIPLLLAALTACRAQEPPQARQGLIAFYSSRDGNNEIYLMSPQGDQQRRLTDHPASDDAPALSPDGTQIAFLSTRDDPDPTGCGRSCFYQIYLINTDGSGEHRLVQTGFSALHPDWNPAGTSLIFDSENGLEGDIYQIQADGTGLTLLIEDGFWGDWSPDGSQVVFASGRDGSIELYLADGDGSNQRRLTSNDQLDYFPDWSPDGGQIAYGVAQEHQITLINADGSSPRQLTRTGNAENPSWSPDGLWIAYQSSSDGDFEIYALNVADALQEGPGYQPRQLTENQAGDLWPSWGTAPEGGQE